MENESQLRFISFLQSVAIGTSLYLRDFNFCFIPDIKCDTLRSVAHSAGFFKGELLAHCTGCAPHCMGAINGTFYHFCSCTKSQQHPALDRELDLCTCPPRPPVGVGARPCARCAPPAPEELACLCIQPPWVTQVNKRLGHDSAVLALAALTLEAACANGEEQRAENRPSSPHGRMSAGKAPSGFLWTAERDSHAVINHSLSLPLGTQRMRHTRNSHAPWEGDWWMSSGTYYKSGRRGRRKEQRAQTVSWVCSLHAHELSAQSSIITSQASGHSAVKGSAGPWTPF
ncbi:PREDICTED: uncharacterized protein LOC102004142 [Chinchilla lanigera]|uniref:uncharacterized protein LOC102004142 n=1 Tax=Chinchilla lanigera TaxID=34839 RepID=UPI00038ECA29|nr:PREDICTED: uncharacterized protein LOC102004142 [Chinchilla lanigera]